MSIEERIARIEGRLEEIERWLTSIDNRLNHISSRIDTWLKWTLGILITMWTTIILAILLT